jgi:hypothetical protein
LVVKTRLATIPDSLMLPCHDPVDLPDSMLTSAQVARLWASDRSALGDCRRRHKALSDAAKALEDN